MKKELKKMIKKEYTAAAAKKAVKETIKYNMDNYFLDIRVYSIEEDGVYYSDLYIEICNSIGCIETLTAASIVYEETEGVDFWNFKEAAEAAFKTLKKNTIKDFQYFNIRDTTDYTC